jgi:hypothetical protein
MRSRPNDKEMQNDFGVAVPQPVMLREGGAPSNRERRRTISYDCVYWIIRIRG